MKNTFKLKYVFASLLSLAISQSAFATGFFLPYESISDVGVGLAGGAALAEDASTNYNNSAGITRLKHPQLVVGAVGVFGRNTFNGTMTNPGALSLSPVTETGTVRGGLGRGVVPNMHYATPLSHNFSAALSIVVPYALGLSFPSDSLVRYEIIYGKQGGVDISPSLAYQVTPQLSIAAGPDFLRYFLAAKQAVRTQPLTATDSYATGQASAWNYGFHAGILYQATPATRVGLAHHSQFINYLSGNSKFFLAGDGSTFSNNARIKLPMASLTTLSAHTDVNSKWAVMGTVEYMNWSIYSANHFSNLATPTQGVTADIVELVKLNNAWIYALGSTYQYTDRLMLRAGAHYAQGASSTAYRSIAFPDATLLGVNAAVRYQVTPAAAVDVMYGHIFDHDTAIHHTNITTGGTLNGVVSSSGNIFGAQLTWTFV